MSAEIAARGDLDRLLNDLKQHAPAWIAAGEANERPRRQLAAATFALEAARAAEHAEWKWIQNNRLGPDPVSQVEGGKFLPSTYRPQPALWWKTPPLLIEWACDLLRQGSVPKPTERVWHLAAVSVAQRRSDYEFLLGSPWEVRENPKDEIEHLNHVSLRFTDEPRFALAQAVAIDWRTWPLGAKHPRTAVAFNAPDAMRAFELQLANPTTGAEAAVRLGVLRLRTRNLNGALELFARAETQTRDRYLLYLSRYFSGQARERQKRPEDAERAYRGALATIPGSISATMALSAVLVRAGRVSEATTLVEAALTANPTPVDPWRTFATADDRFWRVLLARLHDAIRPGAGDADAGAGATIAPAYMQHAETDCGSACEDDGDANEQQQQQPVFRTRTDLVTIDVSVRSQGTPIAGLTAKDFVLLDNGVPQAIEQIDMEAVPVDVSILVDLNEDLADDLKGMSEQVPRIMNLLRPDDRVRVTAINTHVGDLLPLHRADIAPDVGRFRPSGLSSAHDGLAAALLRETDPNRRHLIIALTNGIDAISALDARAVRDIARVSDATLYIAQVDVALDPAEGAAPIYLSGRERADRARCMASGVCSPTKRFWQPYGEYDFDILAEAAAMTGGSLYLPGVFTDRTAAAIFKKVFEDYRRSYVLRYTPKGVAAAGWHEVKVTIPGHAGYELQARRGYFVEAPGRYAALNCRRCSLSSDAGEPDSVVRRRRLHDVRGGAVASPESGRRRARAARVRHAVARSADARSRVRARAGGLRAAVTAAGGPRRWRPNPGGAPAAPARAVRAGALRTLLAVGGDGGARRREPARGCLAHDRRWPQDISRRATPHPRARVRARSATRARPARAKPRRLGGRADIRQRSQRRL